MDGEVWRCPFNKNHEISIRDKSYFSRTKTSIQDVLLFVISYIEGNSLHLSAQKAGIQYKSTAVDWASYVREIAVEYVYCSVLGFNTGDPLIFRDHVEIDESLFGRKRKYNRGASRGHQIWIVGLVERSTNRIILYPVDSRDSNTLISIITRHVEVGTHIYTDGWAGYSTLNSLGYKHFTVEHKTSFSQSYKDTVTGEIVSVNTNRIEGAWKHAKAHLRQINGTKINNFESYLCWIIYKNHISKTNRYTSFFDLVRKVYTLDTIPTYSYTSPLFDTWSIQSTESSEEDTQYVSITRVDSSGSESDERVLPSLLNGPIPTNITVRDQGNCKLFANIYKVVHPLYYYNQFQTYSFLYCRTQHTKST